MLRYQLGKVKTFISSIAIFSSPIFLEHGIEIQMKSFQLYIDYLTGFSIAWSLLTLVRLFLRSNNIYSYRLKKHIAMRQKAEKDRNPKAEHDENQKSSLVRLTNFAGSAWWKLGLFTKYTVAPILDKFPSWSFRLLAYWIILTYLMEFYHGPGVLFPLFLFFAIVLCTHLLGYKRLHLKWEESIVNACCGIIVPIYVDIFSMVRYPKYISYH